MLKTYLLTAWRSLRKNPGYAFLNIVGLAVGLSAGTLILLWVMDEWRYDRFHERLPQIHVLLQDQTSDGQIFTFQAMPGPLAGDLLREFPEITNAARASWPGTRLVRTGDKLFREPSMFVEPSFFEMFSFPAIAGDPKEALKDPGSLVITERLAKKLFGSQEPIGQTINLNNRYDYRVAAVIKDIPLNSSIRFDIAIPFSVYEKSNADWITSYGNNSLPTWIETAPGTDLAALNGKLYNFIQTKEADAIAHVHAWPMSRWRLESQFKEGKPNGGRIDMVRMMGLLGIALILVACINFMNLATARSAMRAREVGVRKAVGAHRGRLIAQFLGEAVFTASLSLVVALGLAWLCLPFFNRITEKELALGTAGPAFWWVLLGAGLVSGLVAGSYPALYLSKFNPVRVLKNDLTDVKTGGAIGLRRILVVAQFTFSTFLILCTIFLWQQIEHLRNRPLGFEKESLIRLDAGPLQARNFEAFKNQTEQLPGVKQVACASIDLFQYGSNTTGIGWPGKTDDQQFLITIANIGRGFMQTTGMKLKEGRDFEGPKDSLCVILNETAVKRMGLKDPLGQQIERDTQRTIIGVVEDFVQNSPGSLPTPTCLFWGESDANYFFIRMENNDHWDATLSQIGAIHKNMWPNFLYEPRFVTDESEKRFQQAKTLRALANIFGGLSIFISCLGLFGLAAFTAERRNKEIGIRKVLGASVAGITGMLARDFLKLVFISVILACPIGYFAVNKALSMVDYRIEISAWVFVAAGITAIVIAFLTVSFQSIRAALTNPVKSLRSE